MADRILLKNIFKIEIIDPVCGYVIMACFFALVIRIILCIFKACACNIGESDDLCCNKNEKLKDTGFGKLFKDLFCSNSRDVRLHDHWLPFIMGIIELLIFPFLMAIGVWDGIIAWVGIKALGSWGGNNKRTAYNRFLFGNILTLFAAGLLTFIFIQ